MGTKIRTSTKELWKWKSHGGWISDISVNSFDDLAALGQGGTIFGWDKELNRWKQYPGKKSGGLAITILANNQLFVCFKTTIEQFIPHKGSDRFKGKWVKIPGCCKDIDSNGFHKLVAIGCDNHQFGYGIWRNLGGDYKRWKRILGQAVTIGIGSRGHVVVSNRKNNIFWKENFGTAWVMTAGLAFDVTVSVGGVMVVIGTDHHVYYSKVAGPRPQWVKNNGMGYRVACWSWRNPLVVGMDHAAWRALKN